jgi:hypothetical protein
MGRLMPLADVADAQQFQWPEAYQPESPSLRPYAEAFGAGLIDPAGIPSWLANWIMRKPLTDWYKRRMQEARDQSPMLAGAGSAAIPALLAGPLVGGPLLGAGSTAEAMNIVPPIMGIGSALGKMSHHWYEPPSRQRPQAAYPGGGF